MKRTCAGVWLTWSHWLQDVHVHVQRELTVLDQPMSTVGDVAMGLEVTFLNSAVDSVGKAASQQSCTLLQVYWIMLQVSVQGCFVPIAMLHARLICNRIT